MCGQLDGRTDDDFFVVFFFAPRKAKILGTPIEADDDLWNTMLLVEINIASVIVGRFAFCPRFDHCWNHFGTPKIGRISGRNWCWPLSQRGRISTVVIGPLCANWNTEKLHTHQKKTENKNFGTSGDGGRHRNAVERDRQETESLDDDWPAVIALGTGEFPKKI